MVEVPLVPPLLRAVLNSMRQLVVAVALVPGQAALGKVQEAWVPPELALVLHQPEAVQAAVPSRKLVLPKEVPVRSCT